MENETQEKKSRRWGWVPFLLAILLSFFCVFTSTALALMSQPDKLDDASMLPIGTANYGELDSEKERFGQLDAAIFADATQDSAGLRLTPDGSGETAGNRKTPVFIAFITPGASQPFIPSPVVVTMDAPETAVPTQKASPSPTSTRRPTRTPILTATSTSTRLAIASVTPTPWPTVTSSATPMPTATPVPQPTATSGSSNPPTSTPRPAATNTPVPPTTTNTATATQTPTSTATPGNIQGVRASLINADTDAVISGYEDMPDGIVLDLTLLPTENLNVWILMDPVEADHVDIHLDGAYFNTHDFRPYTFPSDWGGDYDGYNFSLGPHTLTFYPYAITGTPGGVLGIPYVFNFTVIRSTVPTDTPTPTPTNTPTVPTDTPTPTPTDTPTVPTDTPTPTPTNTPIPVVPIVSCIANRSGGQFAVVFAYRNDNSFTVDIPSGANNQFTPGPIPSQTTSFAPGQHTHLQNPALVFSPPGSLSWELDGNIATADSNTPLCP
jgi:hypothetical protein